MSRVFVDTSGVVALLVSSDRAHRRAKRAFETLRARRSALITTSYVLVETNALLGRRLGMDAVRAFREDFAPLLEVVWVTQQLHERGLDDLITRRSKTLSLVDVISFLVFREQRLEEALAYDRHFEQEGIDIVMG
jgi:predicted nucleic acid-binding protein